MVEVTVALIRGSLAAALRAKPPQPQMPELTGQDLVDYIRQERRLELCYEGFRWFDLRRYGMPSFSRDWVVNGEKVATYVIAEKDPSYTLPIPEQVLEKNKNLEQNTLANPR